MRLDMAALRRAAGDTTFVRGEAYHRHLRGTEDQGRFVSALKARHGRKRNLMKLLA